MTTDITAQLILAFAILVVLGIVFCFAYAMGVFAVAPRGARELAAARRTALTATVVPPIQSPMPAADRQRRAGMPRIICGALEQ